MDCIVDRLFELMRHDYYPENTQEDIAIVDHYRAVLRKKLRRRQRVMVLRIIDAQDRLLTYAELSAFRSGLQLGLSLWREMGDLTLPGT